MFWIVLGLEVHPILSIFVFCFTRNRKCFHWSFKSALDMDNGCIADMIALGITESFKVKRQALISAAEAAEMVLRVDDIIRAAPR